LPSILAIKSDVIPFSVPYSVARIRQERPAMVMMGAIEPTTALAWQTDADCARMANKR